MAEETASAAEPVAPPPASAGRAASRTALWVHVAGWYGVAAILGAYFLTTHGKLDADGLRCGYNVRNYVTLRMLREIRAWVE